MSVFRSAAFVVAFLFVASELSHAGHRCSSQVLGSAPPPCLLPVYSMSFYLSLLAPTPLVPPLASPDRMSSGMGRVTWSLQPGLCCGWYWLCPSNATFSLSPSSSPKDHATGLFTSSI